MGSYCSIFSFLCTHSLLQIIACPLSFFFWPYCLSFFDIRISIIPLVSSNPFLSICPLAFGHCIVCPSIYGVWLSVWYSLKLNNNQSLFPDSCHRLNTIFRFNLETKTSDSSAIFHPETELTNNNNINVDMKFSAHDAFMQ